MARKKRRKKSGIVYFAENSRIKNMVKIGLTVDSAVKRLESANKRNEFMPGKWKINIKVKTNNVERTEELAHKLFEKYHDKESVSNEMFFIPPDLTVKKMADIVRSKDAQYKDFKEKEKERKRKIEEEKLKLKELEESSKQNLFSFD